MKKVLSLFLSLIIAFLIMTTSVPVAFAAKFTGSCGSSVLWFLDTYSGELVISGDGNMENYSAESMPPWSIHQSYIRTIMVSDGVTSVGDYAFYNITGYKYQKLTTVTMSPSVETIGDYAFRGCKALTTVIGTGVKTIGEYAFRSCEKLFSLNLVSVVSVGNGAFSYCTGITSLPIPQSVTTIGPSAFKGCTGLASLVLPDNIISLGDHAFAECTGLISVDFCSSKINSVVYGAFYGSGVESGMDVTFGDNVTTVPANLFENCSNIDNVDLGNGVTTISTEAFYASGIRSIHITPGVSNIADYAFSMCNRLTGFTVDASNTVYFAGSNGELMTKQGDQVYLCCYPSGRGATSYVVPSDVTIIGRGAFKGDSTLVSVNLSNALTVYNQAFALCSALESVSMPKAVMINHWSFADCDNLKTLIATKVTDIKAEAFWGCDRLSALSGFTSLTTIDSYAFANCKGFTNLTIPSKVTSIGEYAFYNCNELRSLTLPVSVRTVSTGAFSGCDSLSSATLNNGLTTVGSSAFLDCPALLSIKIPSTVTSIGDYAFGFTLSNSSYKAVPGFKIYCYGSTAGYSYAYKNKNALSYEIVTDDADGIIILPENPDDSVETPTETPDTASDFISVIFSVIQHIFDFVQNIINANSLFGNWLSFGNYFN